MKKFVRMVAALGVFTASSAQAMPINIEMTQLDWSNPVHGSNIVYADNDGISGNEEISWGVPVHQEQSGYELDLYSPTFDIMVGQNFLMGDFTHHNYVMKRGTSIYEATLNMDMSLSTPFFEDTISLSFLVDHTETSNNCTSSATCSNDKIQIFGNSGNQFTFDHVLFEFEILGFMQYGVLTDIFSTIENQSNTPSIVGRVNTVAVNEPATLGLLSLGLGGLLLARRKQVKVNNVLS